MSETLRIALVSEGVTDYIVIGAAISAILGERSFDLTLLQPESSAAFMGGDAGIHGGGWKGVFNWCQKSAKSPATRQILLQTYDLLIFHLDADVGEDPNENNWPAGLPLIVNCPPASDKTDALRLVILGWLGLSAASPQFLFCTPSKNTEAWVVWLFCPNDRELNRYRNSWECYASPHKRLAQLPKATRFDKNEEDYKIRSKEFSQRWPELVAELSQAARFQKEFLAAIP